MSQCDSYCLGKKYFGSRKLASLRVYVRARARACVMAMPPSTVEGWSKVRWRGSDPKHNFLKLVQCGRRCPSLTGVLNHNATFLRLI